MFQDLNAGSKQKKESFVSFSGDGLRREESVSELKKFIYQSVKSDGFLNAWKESKKKCWILQTYGLFFGLRKYALLVVEILQECTGTYFTVFNFEAAIAG